MKLEKGLFEKTQFFEAAGTDSEAGCEKWLTPAKNVSGCSKQNVPLTHNFILYDFFTSGNGCKAVNTSYCSCIIGTTKCSIRKNHLLQQEALPSKFSRLRNGHNSSDTSPTWRLLAEIKEETVCMAAHAPCISHTHHEHKRLMKTRNKQCNTIECKE